MAEPRRILTVHSPIPPQVLDDLLTGVENALRRSGAARVWIDCRWSPDLLVMAELAAADVAVVTETVTEGAAVVPQPR
jgi:hypothetical protein